MSGAGAPARRSLAFILVVALANGGGVIAYMPLLSLLLPIRVVEIAGPAKLDVLTGAVIVGALAASGSNILFGWLSDRSVARGGGRRGWAVFGLAATALSFAAVAIADDAPAIVAAVALFQIAVNALLAPLFAIMAEEVPDAQKGLSGGLLSFGQPMAAGVSTLILCYTIQGMATSLALVIVAVAICVAPLAITPARLSAPATPDAVHARLPRRDLAIAWAARLLLQVAGNVMMFYVFYYFQSITPDAPHRPLAIWTGGLLTIGFLATVPVAVVAGRLADRSGQRRPIIAAMGVLAATGLGGMALAADRWQGAAAFIAYAVGVSAFLALHAGFAMQLLPDPRHRGRDLGLLNLTNTLPALMGPLLAWLLATPRDFSPLLAALALLSLGASALMLMVRAAGGGEAR